MLIKYCRLKLHAQEMFDIQELFEETGIDNTWRNHSNSKRIAVQLQKRGKYIPYIFMLYTKKYIEKTQRKAAERRAKNPKLNLPWNPQNPFDTPEPQLYRTPSVESSTTLGGPITSQETMIGNDTASVSNMSCVSTAYAGDMLPPPPSRTRTPRNADKRHRSQLSTEEVEREAHAQRMGDIGRRISQLQQAKEAHLKVKELVELKEWAKKNDVRI